ncbi:hypothetical protein LCGC14_2887660, partial [marine sediment metagenome]
LGHADPRVVMLCVFDLSQAQSEFSPPSSLTNQ